LTGLNRLGTLVAGAYVSFWSPSAQEMSMEGIRSTVIAC
jgi:hypothetical protein